MMVQVRYFASLREAIGQDAEQVNTAALTVGQLRDELAARGGGHAQALSRTSPRAALVRAALNQRMVGEDAALADGAELAFFPPVTGG